MIRKQRVVVAQIEKWEESCNCQHFQSLLRQSHFMTPRPFHLVLQTQETMAFPSDPYDLKVLKSFRVLCFFGFFSSETLSCWFSVILPFSQKCSIINDMKHRSTLVFLHSKQMVKLGILCAGFQSHKRAIEWNNHFGSFFLLCVIICTKTSVWMYAFSCLPNIRSPFNLAGHSRASVCDSKSEMNTERRSLHC